MSATAGEPLFDTLLAASATLKRVILTPAMLAVWVLGLTLVALNPALASGIWFVVKLLLVVGLTGVHGYFSALGKKIDAGEQPVTSRRLRMLNEIPFLLMILIVFLVVLKPF